LATVTVTTPVPPAVRLGAEKGEITIANGDSGGFVAVLLVSGGLLLGIEVLLVRAPEMSAVLAAAVLVAPGEPLAGAVASPASAEAGTLGV
jgi:hypothetical protein